LIRGGDRFASRQISPALQRSRRHALADIKAFRDAEETRLLPIMKAAGIKPE
jgi:hypothetical protein